MRGNPYCYNGNLPDCAMPAPPAPVTSTGSNCTNGCPSDEYAINPNIGNCQCARPVVGNVTFVATKVPRLFDNTISQMQQKVLDGLNADLVPLKFDASQIAISSVSNNQALIAVFPTNTSDAWNANDAASISYVLKNQDIEFDDIGPLICSFTGNPYTTGEWSYDTFRISLKTY